MADLIAERSRFAAECRDLGVECPDWSVERVALPTQVRLREFLGADAFVELCLLFAEAAKFGLA